GGHAHPPDRDYDEIHNHPTPATLLGAACGKDASALPFERGSSNNGQVIVSAWGVAMLMRNAIIATTVFMLGLTCAPPSHAACIPKGLATPAPQDPVARVLAAPNPCPNTPVHSSAVL